MWSQILIFYAKRLPRGKFYTKILNTMWSQIFIRFALSRTVTEFQKISKLKFFKIASQFFIYFWNIPKIWYSLRSHLWDRFIKLLRSIMQFPKQESAHKHIFKFFKNLNLKKNKYCILFLSMWKKFPTGLAYMTKISIW